VKEKLKFDKWWDEFTHSREVINSKGEIDVLTRAFLEFDTHERQAFIDELLKREKYYIACEYVPKYGTDEQKQLIRDKLTQWLNVNDNTANGNYFIMAILKTYKETDHELVKRYFSTQRTVWFTIPVELFGIDPSLFLSAFKKFLPRFNDEKLYEYETLSYLIYSPDTIEFLIDNLNNEQSDRIKKFCVAKAIKPWYNEDTRKELIRLSNK